jgi:hypothetical protein
VLSCSLHIVQCSKGRRISKEKARAGFVADVNILITILVGTFRSNGLEKSFEGVFQGKATGVTLHASQVN